MEGEHTGLLAAFALFLGFMVWQLATALRRKPAPPPLASEEELRERRVRSLRGENKKNEEGEAKQNEEGGEENTEGGKEGKEESEDESDVVAAVLQPVHAACALADCPAPVPGAPSAFETLPLKTLEALMAWSPPTAEAPQLGGFNRGIERLPADSTAVQSRGGPQLLVCHDMRGGYIEDRWVQGAVGASDAYRLYHWHLIDTFVYFSHDFISIPPVGWTNAAHRHGTLVLGTIITEWEAGAALCSRLLASEATARAAAAQLVAIARTYRFDGWLVNIENPVAVSQLPHLRAFVQALTDGMRAVASPSQVLWYDAVTASDGQLRHQSQLNSHNSPFFDVCDGLFVDYHWPAEAPAVSAALAPGRRYDIYFGIDVFGRGTLGGGGMNSDVALQVLRNAGVSAALFAPGWVHETKGPQEAFVPRQDEFWAKIGAVWPPLRRAPLRPHFWSTFDQGVGERFSVGGVTVRSGGWYNLSMQSSQPCVAARNSTAASADVKSSVLLALTHHHSFDGGTALLMQGVLEGRARVTSPVFNLNVRVSPSGVLEVAYAVARAAGSDVCLVLRLEGAESLDLVLRGPPSSSEASASAAPGSEPGTESGSESEEKLRFSTLFGKASSRQRQLFYLPVEVALLGSRSQLGSNPAEVRADVDAMRRRGVPLHEIKARLSSSSSSPSPSSSSSSPSELQWQRRTYRLRGYGGREVRHVSVVCCSTPGAPSSVYRALLGEVSIRSGSRAQAMAGFAPNAVRGLRAVDVTRSGSRLQLTLLWKHEKEKPDRVMASAWDVLHLAAGGTEQRWMGRARCAMFRLDLELASDSERFVLLAVQPISAAGVRQSVASTLTISL